MLFSPRFPEPNTPELLSPTAINDLFDCPLRAAYRFDSSFTPLRLPSPASSLGRATHGVLEALAKGLLAGAGTTEEARSRIEAEWDRQIAIGTEDLQSHWSPTEVPDPPDWPGYHLTRARLLKRARPGYAGPSTASRTRVVTETLLSDGSVGIKGKPDRIEGPEGDRCVVDFKSGLRQDEPTRAQRRQLLLYAHLVEVEEGELPRSVAVENPVGMRWSEQVKRDELDELLAEISRRRQLLSQPGSAIAEVAQADEETCRWCDYRLVCPAYWDALEDDWEHGSFSGVLQETERTANGLVLRAEGGHPTPGLPYVLREAHDEPPEGSTLFVVDAERTSTPGWFRSRWNTRLTW